MILSLYDIFLYYRSFGSGRPLILLHGNGEDSSIFDKLAETLSNYFTIYVIDSRSHGRSSATDEISYDLMVTDLLEFIRKLDLQNPFVLGFSDGAIIALQAELKKHGTFCKMILLGINLHPSDFLKAIYRDILNEYNETHNPLLALMLHEPDISLSSLGKVDCPVLLINGQYDIFRKNLTSDMLRMLPLSSAIEINGHTHDTYIVHSDLISEIVIEFLNKNTITKKEYFSIVSNKAL